MLKKTQEVDLLHELLLSLSASVTYIMLIPPFDLALLVLEGKTKQQMLTCVPLFVCLVELGVGGKPTDHAPVGMLRSDQRKSRNIF